MNVREVRSVFVCVDSSTDDDVRDDASETEQADAAVRVHAHVAHRVQELDTLRVKHVTDRHVGGAAQVVVALQQGAGGAEGAVAVHFMRHRAGEYEALVHVNGERLPPPGLYHRILKEIEVPLLTAALAATRGNQIRAADLLGLNRNTLRKRIRELGIWSGRQA